MATDESFLGPAGMPFFNNAESVYIDGKEVQSIVVKDTGGILFQKSNDIVDSPVMTLTADKSILSYLDNDTATLTATLTGGSVSGKTVEFFNGAISLGTSITNSNGVATKSYASQGIGDIEIFARVGTLSSETYELEDCQYYNSTEKTYGGTNNHQLYDSNLSVALATNQEISFDVKTGTTSDNKDYRYWVFPKSQFSGMSYPSCAVYFDKKPSKIWLGKIENGTQTGISYYNTASNQYIRVKYVKEGTSIKVYTDDTLQTTISLSCIDNYSDWTVGIMTWSGSETRYIKNVKFKPL